MNQSEHHSLTLAQESADEKIIRRLYAQGFINEQGRIFALEWLTPHQRWGYWIAQLCALVGCTLVLAGMIFFFAHNWQKMSVFYKFTVIEAAIICALLGAWVYSLEKTGGKLSLICASILVGVFLAVFGQIYQTGADAYQLFVTWSLLIAPWVLISRFAALWLIWLVLINLSCILYWQQMIAPAAFDRLLFTLLMLINGIFLSLREYAQHKKLAWLQANWQRIILLMLLLTISFIPLQIFIHQRISQDYALMVSAGLGGLIQIGLFIFYRYYHFDRWALTLILLSYCLLLLSSCWRFSAEFHSHAVQLLFMAISTLVIFTLGATLLKNITRATSAHSRLNHAKS